MSVASDAVSLAAYIAAEEALRRDSLFSSSVRRLFGYIISNRDQANNERHKFSTRIDNWPPNGPSWQRFPYSVLAYCSDQQNGDWILDLLSYAGLAAVPEADEGGILDFSEAGYRKRLRVILICTT